MTRSVIAAAVEAVLFVAERPVPRNELAKIVGAGPRAVDEALTELERAYAVTGLRLAHDADDWQIVTAPEAAPFVAAYLGAVSVPPLGGWGGAAVALVSIYLPSFLLLFGVLPYWDGLRRSAAFRRALVGTNAAVVGLLAAALYRPIWTGAIESSADVSIAAAGLALLVWGRVPPIAVVVLAAVAGQLVRG